MRLHLSRKWLSQSAHRSKSSADAALALVSTAKAEWIAEVTRGSGFDDPLPGVLHVGLNEHHRQSRQPSHRRGDQQPFQRGQAVIAPKATTAFWLGCSRHLKAHDSFLKDDVLGGV